MAASKIPNFLVENVVPSVDSGKYPAKMIVGETCHVEADIFRDGHDPLEIQLCWRFHGKEWNRLPMKDDGNDRWAASFPVKDAGEYEFTFQLRNGADFAPVYRLIVDPPLARFGAWYEMFVRSQGKDPKKSGTFKDAEERLGEIKELGFDVIYLAPINPIGRTARKGPNNSLQAGPNDPGSPWAIGNEWGGHTAVAPELGTLKDFDHFVQEARKNDLEIALDFAPHCSPDHPWVKEHPEWFYHRPDGSIQCAENPPYKYEDIYPLNFNCDEQKSLFNALRDVFLFWAKHGIQIFRIDNPHTKPVFFWGWVIAEVKRAHPETIFLAEAFTKPKMMMALSKAGFSQSYTYFIWRATKKELTEYVAELAEPEKSFYFRPNFFVTTPDVLPEYLQSGGRPMMLTRFALAAALSPSYGIINGFELGENQALPGTVEYANSEKFEIRVRNWNQSGNFKDVIKKLNQIRRQNPALQRIDTALFVPTDNDQVLGVIKMTPDRSNLLFIWVNLDPHHTQQASVQLPMEKIGFSWEASFDVEDLMTGQTHPWSKTVFVQLDPNTNPFQIFCVKR